MTHTEHLEQSWRNLERDVRSRLCDAKKQSFEHTLAAMRVMSMAELLDEVVTSSEGRACASVLDLIHTAMRELGLRYD